MKDGKSNLNSEFNEIEPTYENNEFIVNTSLRE